MHTLTKILLGLSVISCAAQPSGPLGPVAGGGSGSGTNGGNIFNPAQFSTNGSFQVQLKSGLSLTSSGANQALNLVGSADIGNGPKDALRLFEHTSDGSTGFKLLNLSSTVISLNSDGSGSFVGGLVVGSETNNSLTTNSITATDANKKAVSLAIGSGLSSDGTTLTATSGGGGNVSTNSNGSVPLIGLDNVIDGATRFQLVGDNATENRPAMSNLLNYAFSTNHGYSTVIKIRNGSYFFGSNSVDSTHGNNSLLTIPAQVNVVSNWSMIIVKGEEPPAFWEGSNTQGPHGTNGCVFRTTMTNAVNWFATDNWTNTAVAATAFQTVCFENITFVVPDQCDMTVMTLANAGNFCFINCSFQTVSGVGTLVAGTAPKTNSMAIFCPRKDNGNFMMLERVNISGFTTGVKISEHLTAMYVNVAGCVRGIDVGAGNYGNEILSLSSQACQYPIYNAGISSHLHITRWVNERANTSGWAKELADIADSSNAINGGVDVYTVLDDTDHTKDNTWFLPNGGAENFVKPNPKNPGQRMHTGVATSDSAARGLSSVFIQNSAAAGGVSIIIGSGTLDAPSAVAVGRFPWVHFGLYDNTPAVQYPCWITAPCEVTPTPGNVPSGLGFWTGTNETTIGERMRIDHSGNVGIGTTAPSAKLDVIGAANVSDTVTSTNGILLPWSGGSTVPFTPIRGAGLFSDGTNLIFILQNGGGVKTTNKVTFTSWP